MNTDKFQNRIIFLTKLITTIENKLRKVNVEGNLRIFKDKKTTKYYLISKKADTNGKYLKKKDLSIAQKIAQRDYYIKLLKEATREKKALEKYVAGMCGTAPEDVYDELNELRRELVEPALISDRKYVVQWLSEEYRGNPYEPSELLRETKRGDRVRTKSEELLANMYYEMGIPYKYEYPFTVYDGRVKYPDFVLLKMPERKEIYHEHLGLLEDDTYRKTNLIKLRDYSKSGLYLGDNLIITYETDYVPLNIPDTRKMIGKIFFESK